MNDDLRGQYENYSYPPRDPADEAKRLIAGSPSHICEIEHHIMRGIRNAAGYLSPAEAQVTQRLCSPPSTPRRE